VGLLTQADDDAAQARLKRWFRDQYGPRPFEPAPRRSPQLSDDAKLVGHLRAVLRARGIHVDPFRAVQAHLPPGWDRARWDRADQEWSAARGEPIGGIAALSSGFGSGGS